MTATEGNNAVFSANMTVRCYEQDLKGRLRPGEVFNWFQEIATNQCRVHHVALEDLLPRGYTWVIHRYKIAAAKMPVYGQECRISTWAHPKRDLISIREFSLKSLAGESLVTATTAWALLDLNTNRPSKLSPVMSFPVCETRALREDLKPIKPPEGAPLLKTTETAATACTLDKNNHVNNSVYITWAYDNLYPEIASEYRLKELEINYKKQTFLGQAVECRSFKEAESRYFQEIRLKESGETLALLRSEWRKENEL